LSKRSQLDLIFFSL